MPKLLQINVTVNTGSTGRIAEEIGALAIDNGFESIIAYGRVARESKSQLIKIGNKYDFINHVIQTRLLDKHCFASKKATIKLVEQIKEIKPDIIHIHNLHGYYIHAGILFDYLSTTNTPIVWTFHDCWTFTGHCSFFDRVKCLKWQTECNNCPIIKEYPNCYGTDQSKRNFHKKKKLFNSVSNLTIVTPCQWLGTYVASSFLSSHQIRIIHNGVNLELFNIDSKSEKMNPYKDKKIIIGVANVWKKKQAFCDFLKLSKLIPENQTIILVGLTNKESKGLPNNIVAIPRTDSIEELAALYSMANVFVNPTYLDNFPTTNIEALACGTPVVTYRTGGSPEAINNQTGIVVEQGDLEGLNNAIQTIIKKGKDHYAPYCRNRAVEMFNNKERNTDYIDLYQQILSNKEV